uniref:Coiled-coil domain containing 162 n=1 Tax=Oryctolagus cuniculus TaxID=9986 RepID=G1SQ56_RABIT
MFRTLPEKAAFRALQLTLRLVAPLHDIVAYLLSFAKLGNGPASFECPLSPSAWRGDWGGTEGIGSELRELQKMLDNLQSPRDPCQVSQALLLHREILLLQFDTAVRHRIRNTFLAAGNVRAYQSVTAGMCHGLPPLSSCLTKSIFASQLGVPPPLDPRSLQASLLFPWRALLEDGGLFPAMSSSPDSLEHGMQPTQSGGAGSRSRFPSSTKTAPLLEGPRDVLASLALLRSFLMAWKQLEALKEHWGQLKLRGRDVDSVSAHKQLSELYQTDILYPSMKAIARKMGKEDEFEGLTVNCQSIFPPQGASEMEIKTQQLQQLLENVEIHMIQEVLRKVNREMTLVLSEKSRKECPLPTDLWKHQAMKENFSISRPQIVEKFIQRLMESYKDGEHEITFRREHLEACLLSLGCDVMARERSSFEAYSLCYEQVLQHARQRLRQKEQELEVLQRGQGPPEDVATQVAELSHDMIMEITALRAQLTALEEENLNLRNQIRKEVQEEYEALVQALFVTCLHIKEKLDENQLNLIQRVYQLIGEVRTEGIATMKALKKKWGSAGSEEGMKENTAQEQLLASEQDNCSLAALVCKARSLGRWRLSAQQAHFQGQLSRAEKESMQSKKECLSIQLMAEQEVSLLRQQLLGLRRALARAHDDNARMWKQQDKQARALQDLRSRVAQEALHRRQLDAVRTCSVEKLLEDVGLKEQQLQLLTEEAQRTRRRGQLQQKEMTRELRQVRSRLARERSAKLSAFQRLEELQSQLQDAPPGSPQGLLSQAHCSLSSASTPSRHSQLQFLKTNLMDSTLTRRIQRPKTVPVKHRKMD